MWIHNWSYEHSKHKKNVNLWGEVYKPGWTVYNPSSGNAATNQHVGKLQSLTRTQSYSGWNHDMLRPILQTVKENLELESGRFESDALWRFGCGGDLHSSLFFGPIFFPEGWKSVMSHEIQNDDSTQLVHHLGLLGLVIVWLTFCASKIPSAAGRECVWPYEKRTTDFGRFLGQSNIAEIGVDDYLVLQYINIIYNLYTIYPA